MMFCRLLREETSGGPTEGGAGGGVGPGRAFHSAVQQPPEQARGADGQHFLHPGPAQQTVRLGVVSGKQHQHQRQRLPGSDGMYTIYLLNSLTVALRLSPSACVGEKL